MSHQNEAEHDSQYDPLADVFMRVMCDRWAEKLELTRVEHFSVDDRSAFEFHLRSCLRCQKLVQQYRVVDSYFYGFLLAENMPAAAKAPALPAGLRVRGRFYALWEAFLKFTGQFGQVLSRGWSLILQGSGLALLLLLLGGDILATGAEIRMMPVALLLLALAFALILYGTLLHQQRLGKTTPQHWLRTRSEITERRHVLAWRELSLPMAAISPDRSERTTIHRYQKRSRHLSLRDKWVWSATICLLLTICIVSLTYLLPMSRSDTVIGGNDPTGAPVGISLDGSQVFDTGRQDGDIKRAAASDMLAGNVTGAQELWKQALALDSSDAELLIYRENLFVTDTYRSSYILVVGTIFSQQHIGGARDVLQGAYVAQKEYNDQAMKSGQKLLRLMIAASDIDPESPKLVAQQVVQAAQKDHSIVGVMGWSTSASALSALQVLQAANIPMVSPTASSDMLTGLSDDFFRVAPTDTQQAALAAEYAQQVLHAKRVVLFTDPQDSYSNSLAKAFMQHYQDASHRLIHTPFIYTIGTPSTIADQMNTALQQKPDLIYFAGYVNEASVVLTHLPACQANGQCLLVLGGDALDSQGDYSLDAFKNYGRLRFTVFASEQQSQPLHSRFFADYTKDFDPLGQYRAGSYGYNATDADVILGYDATSVLIQASAQLQAQGKQALTAQNMRNVLTHITVNGVSGTIRFDRNGNPINKPILVLKGSDDGHSTIDNSLHG